jgi:hypothetical protein
MLAIAASAVLGGCGTPAASPSATAATTTAGASTSTTAAGPSQDLTFNLAASHIGRPRKAPESTATLPWFPPAGSTTGLRQVADKQQIKQLTDAAAANGQFWIERPNDHARPIIFGSDAVSILSTSTGFSTALIVPVYGIAPAASSGATDLAAPTGKPVSYQVILSGTLGETSFGLRPGAKSGQWLLDPNGELVNWGNAIDAVGRNVGFVAEQAYVTHSAFDLGGKPALYLTWAVFRDSKGKQYAVTLHSPPPIKATWAIAGQPLRMASVYESTRVFGPVTVTPTK